MDKNIEILYSEIGNRLTIAINRITLKIIVGETRDIKNFFLFVADKLSDTTITLKGKLFGNTLTMKTDKQKVIETFYFDEWLQKK